MRYDTVDWLVVMLTHTPEEACVALEAYSHHLHVLVVKVFLILNQPKYKFLISKYIHLSRMMSGYFSSSLQEFIVMVLLLLGGKVQAGIHHFQSKIFGNDGSGVLEHSFRSRANFKRRTG